MVAQGENQMDDELKKVEIANQLVIAYLGRDANIKITGQEYPTILAAFNCLLKWLESKKS